MENNGFKIFLGILAGAGVIWLANELLKKQDKRISEVGAEAVKTGYTSTLSRNHFGERVEFTTPSGNVIKGYNYPADMNELRFPVSIITKIPVKGWDDSSSFQINKTGNTKKPVSYTISGGVEVPLTYDQLREKTLIL